MQQRVHLFVCCVPLAPMVNQPAQQRVHCVLQAPTVQPAARRRVLHVCLVQLRRRHHTVVQALRCAITFVPWANVTIA